MPTMVKVTYLHSTFEPMDIAIWRFILAVPMMWALVLFPRRSARKSPGNGVPVAKMMIIGVVISAAVLAAFFALERLPGSTYIVLFFSYPAMVAFLSRLLGDAIQPRTWLALALALVGVALTVPDLSSTGSADTVGVVLALINAGIVAVYYLLTRRALAGVEDVSRASAFMMVGTLIIMLLLVPLRGAATSPEFLDRSHVNRHRYPGHCIACFRDQHRHSTDRRGASVIGQHHRANHVDDRFHAHPR